MVGEQCAVHAVLLCPPGEAKSTCHHVLIGRIRGSFDWSDKRAIASPRLVRSPPLQHTIKSQDPSVHRPGIHDIKGAMSRNNSNVRLYREIRSPILNTVCNSGLPLDAVFKPYVVVAQKEDGEFFQHIAIMIVPPEGAVVPSMILDLCLQSGFTGLVCREFPEHDRVTDVEGNIRINFNWTHALDVLEAPQLTLGDLWRLGQWADDWMRDFEFHKHASNCRTFVDAFYKDFLGHEFPTTGILALFLGGTFLAGSEWLDTCIDEPEQAAAEAGGALLSRLGIDMTSSMYKMYRVTNHGGVNKRATVKPPTWVDLSFMEDIVEDFLGGFF
jgi:hypothetical protein